MTWRSSTTFAKNRSATRLGSWRGVSIALDGTTISTYCALSKSIVCIGTSESSEAPDRCSQNRDGTSTKGAV
jgi:hypothetical protein